MQRKTNILLVNGHNVVKVEDMVGKVKQAKAHFKYYKYIIGNAKIMKFLMFQRKDLIFSHYLYSIQGV